jgi:hypothetical protein
MTCARFKLICVAALFVLSAGHEASGQATAVLFRYLPEGASLSSFVITENVEEGPFLDPVEFAARNPGGWGMTAPSTAEFESDQSTIRSQETESFSQPLGPQFSMEVWFRGQESGQTSSLLSNRVDSSEGFTVGLSSDVPYFEFAIQGATYRLLADQPVATQTNVWIAATMKYWQGTLSLRLFVDGVSQSEQSVSVSIPSPYTFAHPVMIGSTASGDPADPSLTGTFTGHIFAASVKAYEVPQEYVTSGIPHDGGPYFGLPSYHDYDLDDQRLPADLRIQSSPVEIKKRFFLPYANDLYIPQGTASRVETTEDGSTPFVYVSYYHRTRLGTIGLQHSIVAEINAETGSVRRAFRLMGQLSHSHVGGVAYSHGALYISSESILERYPLPEWDPSNPQKYLDLEADPDGTIQTPSKASFVSAFQDTLWVGDYRTSSDVAPYLFAHALDEQGRPNPTPSYRFPLPRRIQGVDLIDGPRGTVVVLSRNRSSTTAELLRYRREDLSSSFLGDPDSVIIMPHGIEDLSFFPDGSLWTNSESGTDYYQRKSSGAWSSFYPFVYSIPASSVLGSPMPTSSEHIPRKANLDVDVFPNPFNDTLSIFLKGQHTEGVSVYIFDVLGRRIATLAENTPSSRPLEFQWDATRVPAGAYFTLIQSGQKRIVTPIVRAE